MFNGKNEKINLSIGKNEKRIDKRHPTTKTVFNGNINDEKKEEDSELENLTKLYHESRKRTQVVFQKNSSEEKFLDPLEYFDLIIDIPVFDPDKIKKNEYVWEVQIRDKDNINDWKGRIICVLGFYDKGKSFVLNNTILQQDTNKKLPHGKKVRTKGLSFLKHTDDIEKKEFILIDSAGIYFTKTKGEAHQ
jgi:hypothetical protein